MANGNAFGYFWNSESGDRTYDAESFEMWLKKFFTTGVFNGELEVTEYSGMTVSVGKGYANLDGKVMFFEQDTHITLAPANSTYPRIDTIVVERNDTEREIVIKKITGEYSGQTPTPLPPVREGGVFQIVLAQIYVAAGISGISQAEITDTRPDSAICGYVTGTVEQLDFDQLTAQFNEYISQFEANQKAEFEVWFEEMKDQLSTDAAGHLQSEIDTTNARIDDTNSNVDNLTERINNINDFLATEVRTLSDDGWLKDGGAESPLALRALKSGNVVHVTINGTTAKQWTNYFGWNMESSFNSLPDSWKKLSTTRHAMDVYTGGYRRGTIFWKTEPDVNGVHRVTYSGYLGETIAVDVKEINIQDTWIVQD